MWIFLLATLASPALAAFPSPSPSSTEDPSHLLPQIPLSPIHRDTRCLCKCPAVSTVTEEAGKAGKLGNSDVRSVYINSAVAPEDCDCPHVVLPLIKDPKLTESQADAFCPRCSCDYQIRNLSVMKVVVIIVVWVILILSLYMVFLACLEPVLQRRKIPPSSYLAHHDEPVTDDEDDPQHLHSMASSVNAGGGGGGGAGATQMRTYGTSVMNRLDSRQTRWKMQVEEQRRNIYDRHSMLN